MAGSKHTLIKSFRLPEQLPTVDMGFCQKGHIDHTALLIALLVWGHWRDVKQMFCADMLAFNSRLKNKQFNAAVSAGCLQLWHQLHWKVPPWQALTHAKYTSCKSHFPLMLSHTLRRAQTVSYCVWGSSSIWRAETLSGDLWPLVAESCRVTWGSLGGFQVSQRAFRGLLKDHCAHCVQGLLCLCSISLFTVKSDEQQTCYFNTPKSFETYNACCNSYLFMVASWRLWWVIQDVPCIAALYTTAVYCHML